MCIICYQPPKHRIFKRTLQKCWNGNPDMAGFMYPYKGKVRIRKGFRTFNQFWKEYSRHRSDYMTEATPVVYHFRIATHGAVNKENCHPHRIRADVALAHNGIIQGFGHTKLSDTVDYIERSLKPWFDADCCVNKGILQEIELDIGSYNKFVIMRGDGVVTFCNEKQGIWDCGCWFSNAGYNNTFAYNSYWRDTANNNFGWRAGKMWDYKEKRWVWDKSSKTEIYYKGKTYVESGNGGYRLVHDDPNLPAQRKALGLAYSCDKCGAWLVTEAERASKVCDACARGIYGDIDWEFNKSSYDY